MLVLALIVVILVIVAFVLIVGVRSPWLEERRNRLIVIVVGAVLLAGAFFGVQAWSTAEVERDAYDVAARLRSALAGIAPDQLPSEAEMLSVGLSGIDIAAVDARRDRAVVYAPVTSLGQDRCVRGVVDISGRPTVTVVDESCPSA